MNKTYIIGDIHGCNDELNELIQKIAPDSSDRLIFIGDLIDRGPNSIDVVRQIYRLSKSITVILILGNHEEKFLRFIRHIEEHTGREKEMSGIGEYMKLYTELSHSEIQFMRQAYYAFHMPEYNVQLVHAGIIPNIQLTLPGTYSFCGQGSEKLNNLNLLTRTRFQNSYGNFVSLIDQTSDDIFWAEAYNGQWGHIYFGHQPFLQDHPRQFAYATGIDTGCVFGGWLSAVEIGGQNIRYWSIKARRIYAKIF